MTDSTPAFVSLQQVADRFGVSPKTIRRMISDGAIPARRLGGLKRGPIRISVAALDSVGRTLA